MISALTSKEAHHRFKSILPKVTITNGYIFDYVQSDNGSTPNGFLTSSTWKVEGGLGVLLTTLFVYHTAKVMQSDLHCPYPSAG